MLLDKRLQRALEFGDLVLSLIDRDDFRQRLGNQVGTLVNDAVIKPQRRLAVVSFLGNVRAG
jgi:hypothetical protein